MAVLEFLSSESGLISFWMPLLMVFIAFSLALLSNKKSKEIGTTALTIDQSIVQVTNTYTKNIEINNSDNSKKTSSESNGDVFFIAAAAALIIAVYYLKYRILIVNIATIISSLMFVFWFTQVFSFYNSRYQKDPKWNMYMVMYFILNIASFPLLYNLIDPIYSPFDFTVTDSIVWENNPIAMVIQIFKLDISILPFILYQSFGSVLLFSLWLYMFLNVLYLRSVFSLSHGKSGLGTWFFKKGYRWFSNYWRCITICIVGYLLAFFLVSGLIYKWLQL